MVLEWIAELIPIGGLIWAMAKLHSRVARNQERIENLEALEQERTGQ